MVDEIRLNLLSGAMVLPTGPEKALLLDSPAARLGVTLLPPLQTWRVWPSAHTYIVFSFQSLFLSLQTVIQNLVLTQFS